MFQESTESDAPSDDETASVSSAPSNSSAVPPAYSPCTGSAASSSDEEDHLAKNIEDGNSGSRQSMWCGYKIVIDNIDKNVSPSFQRLDKEKQSLHYTHGYAVKDRVDMSNLSEESPKPCDHVPSDLLPSSDDVTALKKELHILLSRYVTKLQMGVVSKVT